MGLPEDLPVQETNSPDDESRSRSGSSREAKPSNLRFQAAVLQHNRLVYRVCYGILGDAHEAEDVTQETFLKYWQLSGEVRGAKAWLVTVARNRCLDRLRSTKRLVEATPELLEQQPDEESADPEWHASRDERLDRLERLVTQLPEPQRSLIVLFDIQGLTGAECAEALDLNITQVKVYLHRARRALRRALEVSHD